MREGEKEIARNVPPVPSWPRVFDPVHHTVPLRTMHECCAPAVTEEMTGVSTTPGPSTGSIADNDATGPTRITEIARERVA
ncbi:MAG: hypothetical protein RJA15_1204 [Actinomycetota bacterium]